MADPRTPPPGSDAAIEQGCRCPRYDNCRGEGYAIDRASGEPMFVVRTDCPLHGSEMVLRSVQRAVGDHIIGPDPAHNPAERRSDAAPGESHTRAHNGEAA